MLSLDLFQSLALPVIVPRCDTGTEVLNRDAQHWTGRENHSAFDYVLEFANVSRPWVLHQSLHSFAGNRIDRPVHPSRRMLHEMPHERWYVPRTFAQRSNGDRENVEPIVKIAARLLLCHHLSHVPMGRSYDPNLASLRPRATQTLEFPLLQDTKQFRLQLQWHVTDFIKKHQTFICSSHLANFLPI